MSPKPQTTAGYSSDQTELAERVLLEVWTRLGDFHPYLVLVGGLAPRYLVPQERALSAPVPLHCGTMDVDLAVSLAIVDVRAYSSIRHTLTESLGFRPGSNRMGREQRHSFAKDIGGVSVILDFLTTEYDGPPERVRQVQENLSAIQVEGLGLALDSPREVKVRGEFLEEGLVETTVRVCRPVPFIVLKALAFEKRGERKDAYDLIYVLRYAADSPADLARSFTQEERGAPSLSHGLRTLTSRFRSPEHDGPVRYEQFMGEAGAQHAVQAYAAVQEFLEAAGPSRSP